MNKMIKAGFAGLLTFLAIGIISYSVQSEEIPERGPIPFSAYDKDGNGVISEDEFYSVRQERMARRAGTGRPMRGAAGNAPMFTAFDTDGDGVVSQDELASGQQARMQQVGCMGMGPGGGRGMGRNMPDYSEFDLNGDGSIVENEFYEARSKRISERVKQGYPMKNLANAPAFADIDTDADGIISTEEFALHQSQCPMQ